jgi:pimeloyl-ACP methyl ester carboxylesterase
MSGEASIRRDAAFVSEGADLKGWVYAPDSDPPWPLVVMAHGFSATRRMTLDKYAEVFRAAGLAVLLYDHRGFGDSSGEPRRQVNPWIQARGYRDALSYASSLEGVDGSRLALWGDSFGGGVALAVAGIDERVGALVVQVPALGREPPPADPDGSLYRAFEETLLSGAVEPSEEDILGPSPVVSDDQVRRPSALEPLTAYRWFIEYGGRFGSGWANDVSRARPKTPVAWHPGLCAGHVRCPSLFLVSAQDEMPGALPAVSREAYEKVAGPKGWIEIEGGHFGLLYYPSEEFERASSVQARFLSEYLLRGHERSQEDGPIAEGKPE